VRMTELSTKELKWPERLYNTCYSIPSKIKINRYKEAPRGVHYLMRSIEIKPKCVQLRGENCGIIVEGYVGWSVGAQRPRSFLVSVRCHGANTPPRGPVPSGSMQSNCIGEI